MIRAAALKLSLCEMPAENINVMTEIYIYISLNTLIETLQKYECNVYIYIQIVFFEHIDTNCASSIIGGL